MYREQLQDRVQHFPENRNLNKEVKIHIFSLFTNISESREAIAKEYILYKCLQNYAMHHKMLTGVLTFMYM